MLHAGVLTPPLPQRKKRKRCSDGVAFPGIVFVTSRESSRHPCFILGAMELSDVAVVAGDLTEMDKAMLIARWGIRSKHAASERDRWLVSKAVK